MTAIYHRRFYPDDVDGTVPYVAPMSLGAPDLRYAAFLDTVGPPACRQALRDGAIEMLPNRRADADRAGAGAGRREPSHAYTRIPLGPAVEVVDRRASSGRSGSTSASASARRCRRRRPTDDELWGFLEQISPVGDNDDARIAQFEAYYYQAYCPARLSRRRRRRTSIRTSCTPTPTTTARCRRRGPAYDGGAAMRDVDDVRASSDGDACCSSTASGIRGPVASSTLGSATDSLLLVQRAGHARRAHRPARRDGRSRGRVREARGVDRRHAGACRCSARRLASCRAASRACRRRCCRALRARDRLAADVGYGRA